MDKATINLLFAIGVLAIVGIGFAPSSASADFYVSCGCEHLGSVYDNKCEAKPQGKIEVPCSGKYDADRCYQKYWYDFYATGDTIVYHSMRTSPFATVSCSGGGSCRYKVFVDMDKVMCREYQNEATCYWNKHGNWTCESYTQCEVIDSSFDNQCSTF